VTEMAFLKIISIDLELLGRDPSVGKDQQICVDVNMTRMEASLCATGLSTPRRHTPLTYSDEKSDHTL